jgi:ribosomal protein L11 methylase PrmA
MKNLPSSFRDPSGFLFTKDGEIYRQINAIYKEDYEYLIGSELYKALVDAELLIRHDEIGSAQSTLGAYKIIKPELIKFISYPYEWCFSQLKHAALHTLKIQKKAIEFGMSLKDCSAYNIQFRKGKPILIDSLSFEKYLEGKPWVAYKQFCQHFLAPLVLMSFKDIRLNQLFRIYIDGIPLDLASSLLPFRTRLKFSWLFHIHLHAKSQRKYANKTANIGGKKMSRLAFLGLIDSLEQAVNNLSWRPKITEWADYYEITNYSSDAFQSKKQIIAEFLDEIKPKIVWDLGANTGVFSRIASARGIETIAFDIDPAAVEKNYLDCSSDRETNILPLLIDLANPSPNIGWENQERMSFLERSPAEVVFALALIHHLAISNNLPLGRIADFFSKICKWLLIEFVPKSDLQVQRLLSTRKDIFDNYTQNNFESEFQKYFTIIKNREVKDSQRTIYLMRRK